MVNDKDAFREYLFEGKKKRGYIVYCVSIGKHLKLVVENYAGEKRFVYHDASMCLRFEDTDEIVDTTTE